MTIENKPRDLSAWANLATQLDAELAQVRKELEAAKALLREENLRARTKAEADLHELLAAVEEHEGALDPPDGLLYAVARRVKGNG